MPHIEEAALHAYLDGAAPPADAALLEAHLADCERCRARIEDVREVRERASGLLASLEPGPLHAPAFAELEARASRRSAGAVDGADGRRYESGAGVIASADDRRYESAAVRAGARPDESAAIRAGECPDGSAGAGDHSDHHDEAVGGSAAVVATPWWRRPSLAWAASLTLAFGLGWLLRAELGAPSGLFPGPAASFDRPAATAPDAGAPERDELPGVEQKALAEAPNETGAANEQGSLAAVRADIDAAGRAAQQAAAPESRIAVTGESPLVGVVQPPGAPPTGGAAGEPAAGPPVQRQLQETGQAGVAGGRAADEAVRAAQAAEPPAVAGAALPDAAVAGPPAAAGGPPAATQAAATPQPQGLGARAGEVGAERFELEGAVGAMSFATAGGPGSYLLVSVGDVESWLGAPPRRLPELTLLRAEVGPPPVSLDGPSGSPVVRLVYRSENGQEIILTQQLTVTRPEQPAAAGAERGGAPVDPDARLSAEAARRRAAADREVLLRADMAADDLPATVVEPDGTITYRWRDADGYLLALSGLVDADVLRALAYRVR
jgi:anti-sigma factor RsiW